MNIIARNNVNVTGEGPKVLLYAHGFGCNQAMWSQITPAFAATHLFRNLIFTSIENFEGELSRFDFRASVSDF